MVTSGRLLESSGERLRQDGAAVRITEGAPVSGGVVHTDTFDGDGAFDPAVWEIGGFNVPNSGRVAGQGTLDQYTAIRLLKPMSAGAQAVEVTRISGTITFYLNSPTTSWNYPGPDGYGIVVRSDNVVEAFGHGGSFGYSFMTVPEPGSRVRVEHDGNGVLSLYDDGVLMRDWTDTTGPVYTGTWAWVSGGMGVFDDFLAENI